MLHCNITLDGITLSRQVQFSDKYAIFPGTPSTENAGIPRNFQNSNLIKALAQSFAALQ
tara:strand:- start:2726 stop:2902 length:177 start_codon:yes stop_codon:yes gene_type:complete